MRGGGITDIEDSSPGIISISPGRTPSSCVSTFWFQLYSGLGDVGGIVFLVSGFGAREWKSSNRECLYYYRQLLVDGLFANTKIGLWSPFRIPIPWRRDRSGSQSVRSDIGNARTRTRTRPRTSSNLKRRRRARFHLGTQLLRMRYSQCHRFSRGRVSIKRQHRTPRPHCSSCFCAPVLLRLVDGALRHC